MNALEQYKETMTQCIKLYYPDINPIDLSKILDYSIKKRYYSNPARVENSYKNTVAEMTLLDLADYINSREPIVTGFGTMFARHETIPNPLAKTVQSFLDLRGIHKKEMFKYPKGSEMFERYNLMQSLTVIVQGPYTGDSVRKTTLIAGKL